MFFDTHVHFDDFIEDGSLEEVLNRAASANITKMLAVGGSPESNELSLILAERFPERIFGSVGYDRALAGTACDLAALRTGAALPATVAIGEIGLDYFYEPEKARQQKALFLECLDVAVQTGKPVIVHTRDADDDTLGMLTDFAGVWKGDPGRLGAVHCFTRDQAMAKALLDLGFCLSFSGIVTFSNADPLREVARWVPVDRLLIETDSPYLAPIPHRGKRCEPAFVVDTAKRLAEVRGSTVESLAKSTLNNALQLFGLQEKTL